MNKTSKIIIGIVILVIIVGLVFVFEGEKKEEGTVKVGAILPLTGDFASYGQDELDAINLFLEDFNTESSVNIDLLVEDSKSDPKEAVSAFKKLNSMEKPDILLTLGSSIALALKPLVNEQEIPTFAVGSNTKVAEGYMIQNLPTPGDYVEKIVSSLKDNKINSVGLIYRNDDWGSSIFKKFENSFEGDVFAESVKPKETDFRTQVTKIKDKNPQIVFLVSTGKDLGLLIKQVRQLMGDIKIYSVPEINYEDVKETAGEAYNNIIFSDLKLDWKAEKPSKFKEEFVKKYNREPSFDSVVAYNEIVMISECIPYKNSDKFLDCLKSKEFEGLSGKIEVEDNRIQYPIILKSID